MKDGDKTDRAPALGSQEGNQNNGKRGRHPGSKSNSVNNSRQSSPTTASPNRQQLVQKDTDPKEAWVCENCPKSFSSPDAKMLECQRCRLRYCIKCLKKTDI
jgi:hypothetical protein